MSVAMIASAADRRLLDESRGTRAMTWIMAIMLFLTVLAGALGLGTLSAAVLLDRQLAGRLTVQIVEAVEAKRTNQTALALAALRASPEVTRAVENTKAGARDKAKFADELLGWREWFHYQARALEVSERYDRVAGWARASLAEHAGDPRPDLESLGAMLRGETRDESWNACQRQFLCLGWMHNNLRMYWAKRIIAMTPDPETAWATACYLNDRLSLDGRDPATYGNIAAMFGGGQGDRDRSIYGRVTTRGDWSTRSRNGGSEWLAKAASRPVPAIMLPVDLPRKPYLAR